MHLELVVPALFPAQDLPPALLPASLPALELLLARGRRRAAVAADLETWLARAFGLAAPPGGAVPVPAGALTALAHGLDPGAHEWLRADPVHLRADRNRLLLVPSPAFALSTEEAQGLAGALAPLLAGKFVLHAVQPDQWCLRLEGAEASGIVAGAPIALAGADIDSHLPPMAWRRLFTEMQMALYEHPVNTARERRGVPVINSLWLWGAGKLPPAARGPWQSLNTNDGVGTGLARSAGIPHRAPGTGAAEWLARAPEDGRHLLVLDELRGAHAFEDIDALARRLQELEEHWLAPLLAALKAGRVGMLTIHVPEAAASFETVRADLRRFWRRRRPLATYRITPA